MRCACHFVNFTGQGGREKAPAAICRKVVMAEDGGEIEIWGDGKQTRSFLYIDECLEGSIRLTGEYRFGRDGDHQPTGRYGYGDRGEKVG